MEYTHKVGDTFLQKDDPTCGFVLVKERESSHEPGYDIIWFDDGLDGFFYQKDIDSFVKNKIIIKASNSESLRIKLTYSENLTK